VDHEPQPENSQGARLQRLLVYQATLCLGATEQLLKQSAQLGQPRLAVALENSAQAFDHA